MQTPGSVEIFVLGVAQDGGVPHMGCTCTNCTAAVKDEQCAVSLAVIQHHVQDEGNEGTHASKHHSTAWLIDCGPDIKHQWRMLQQHSVNCKLGGIFLTHLHMGHYIGLFQFGKEAMQMQGLKLYCTSAAAEFLEKNQPWQFYIKQGIFVLEIIQPGQPLQLTPSISVKAVTVPHRQEFSDTVGYSIQGPSQSIFWCPDIDSWQEWGVDVRDVVLEHDLSFLDACFYSPDELKRRDMGQIPHPLVTDTMQRLKGLGDKVRLIHMNHTNPIWNPESEQSRDVKANGFQRGKQGEVYRI